MTDEQRADIIIKQCVAEYRRSHGRDPKEGEIIEWLERQTAEAKGAADGILAVLDYLRDRGINAEDVQKITDIGMGYVERQSLLSMMRSDRGAA